MYKVSQVVIDSKKSLRKIKPTQSSSYTWCKSAICMNADVVGKRKKGILHVLDPKVPGWYCIDRSTYNVSVGSAIMMTDPALGMTLFNYDTAEYPC